MYFYLVVGIKSHLKYDVLAISPTSSGSDVLFNPKSPTFSPTFLFPTSSPTFPMFTNFHVVFWRYFFSSFHPSYFGGNEPIFGQHLNTFQCWISPPSLGFLFVAPEVFTKTRGALNPHCRWRRLCVWGAEFSDWADWGRLDSFKRRAKGGISLLEF